MPKRGANGVFWTPVGEVLLRGGHGRYEVHLRLPSGGMGDRIGTTYKRRHTYRTTYSGTRIGYDRTHTCWIGEPAALRPTIRCVSTLGEVVEIMVRMMAEKAY